ncbi:ATP-binding protein [Helicobacter pylori]|uniref:ATP-binding protein n=1 Tax=Helicobacter pylori TaxID=210 RepID=UPI0018845211|nr:ATP-binding protein [Helicobacter pylori]
MILRTQTNFVKFLEQVLGVLKEVEIDKTECSILLESIQKQQLVIPIVGNFSAGKSTLLNRVINLFKESIDKVFDRVSVFTWEKYKEENDDENDDEKNYREFEEIKKMALYFRDCWMFVVEQLDGKSSQEEIRKYKGFVNRNNKLLQLDYSLENLQRLMEYRATNEEIYQADLNNSGLQKDLQEWKSKTTPIGKNVIKFREIKAIILGCRGFYRRHMEDSRCKEQMDECNDLLRLDYSSKNLKRLEQFKNDVYNKTYQEDLQKKRRRTKR